MDYIKELLEASPLHKKTYEFSGIDGLKELDDDTSKILIDWIEYSQNGHTKA